MEMGPERDRSAAPLKQNLAILEGELAGLEAQSRQHGSDMGVGLHAGLAAQIPTVAAEMSSLMERLRVIAGSGVRIPVRATGPRRVDPGRALPHFADGGGFGAGTIAIVGEEGPELVRFGASGFVHTAGETSAMIGGANRAIGRGPASVTIHLSGITVQGVQNPEAMADYVI